MTCSHDSKRHLTLNLFHDLCLTHQILGTASVRPSFEFYFMVCAAPDIRDEVGFCIEFSIDSTICFYFMFCAAPDIREEVGFAFDSASIQLFASISCFVPHMILGTRLHGLLT